jgi:hypothetical protein
MPRGTFTEVAMNLRPGRGRVLRRIERDLAACDPCLDALFFSFTQRVRGEKMPKTEKIRTKPLRLLAWLGRRAGLSRDDEDRLAWPGMVLGLGRPDESHRRVRQSSALQDAMSVAETPAAVAADDA